MEMMRAPKVGLQTMLTDLIVGQIELGKLTVGLCVPPGLSPVDADNDELAACEADYPGYARQPLTNPGWIVYEAGTASFLVDPVRFSLLPADIVLMSAFIYSETFGEILFVLDWTNSPLIVPAEKTLRLDCGFKMSR